MNKTVVRSQINFERISDPSSTRLTVERLLMEEPFFSMLMESFDTAILKREKKSIRIQKRIDKEQANQQGSAEQYEQQIKETSDFITALKIKQNECKIDRFNYRLSLLAYLSEHDQHQLNYDREALVQKNAKILVSFTSHALLDEVEERIIDPLREILSSETRQLTFDENQIIINEGDHGGSAYFVLEGSVRVEFGLPKPEVNNGSKKSKGVFKKLKALINKPQYAELRQPKEETAITQVATFYPQDLPIIAKKDEVPVIYAGTLFGESAALSRTPRSATIIANEMTKLLEIKWQGLSRLFAYGPVFKNQTETIYRERALVSHLESLPMFEYINPQEREDIAERALFESYGQFDWFRNFDLHQSKDARSRLDEEPIITNEGDAVEGLLLIRSGFARLSQLYNHGQRTINYLGKGGVFGLEEVLTAIANPSLPVKYRYSLRSVGYTEAILIPLSVMTEYFSEYAELPIEKCEVLLGLEPTKKLKPIEVVDDQTAVRADLETSLLEFFTDARFINGTKSMLINLDRCTRCDDCVRACADTHDGNPRFVRQGERDNQFMVANACMHCEDPVCLIYCPTGAIHREASGEIVINDDTCIGCSTCAESCPYDNIQMVEIRDNKGHLVIDDNHKPVMKATKCDLCIGQSVSPACEYACPHDALKRFDIHDLDVISDWLDI